MASNMVTVDEKGTITGHVVIDHVDNHKETLIPIHVNFPEGKRFCNLQLVDAKFETATPLNVTPAGGTVKIGS